MSNSEKQDIPRSLGRVESEGPQRLIEQIKEDSRFEALFNLKREFPESQSFIVGGAVRDALLGRTPKDIDFVVRGVSGTQLEKYLKRFGRLKLTGRQFAVYKFVPANLKSDSPQYIEIEIALPRVEQPTGQGGYRDVEIQSDPKLPIEQDLSRRDFTINAMALDINAGQIIDPFAGQKDLQAGVIRAVGEPAKRLGEDYSRMLRAVRFSAKFGFEIEPYTRQAIKDLAGHVNDRNKKGEYILARERIGKEFVWAFAFDPLKTIETLKQLDLLKEILPEVNVLEKIEQYPIFHPEGDVYKHTLIMLRNLPKDASLNLKLAVLLHDLGKARAIQIKDLRTGRRRDLKSPVEFFSSEEYDPKNERVQNIGHAKVSVELARKIMARLKITQFTRSRSFNVSIADVLHIVKYHLLQDIDKMRLSKAEKILFDDRGGLRGDLLKLAKLDPMNGDLSRFESARQTVQKMLDLRQEKDKQPGLPANIFNGHDLTDLGYKPGPDFSKMLEAVRDAQLSGQIKDKQEARKLVQEKYPLE